MEALYALLTEDEPSNALSVVAIQGRDLIGNAAVNLFRFYRLLGLSAMVWMIALIACVAPLLPPSWRTAAAVDAVLMVAWSFALDVAWLVRRRNLPVVGR